MESKRADPVVVDPYAERLAGKEGFELFRRHQQAGGLAEYVTIRTRYLDDAIEKTVREYGIRQVVLVAAGMDTRGFRLKFPAEVTLYEIDHADLLETKDQILSEVGARPLVERKLVKADLRAQWWPSLEVAGFSAQEPSLWVPEGLLFYLTDQDVRRLLTRIASLACPGSRLAVDILGGSVMSNPRAQEFLAALEDDGTAWRFGTDTPEQFLTQCGWNPVEVKQPGEDGANFGRWPYLVPPREREGVPRNFLITATR
jgi:methyltransferase (TIGR00027 family)